MGKQINYWLEHKSFIAVAQKAVDLGCEIVREDINKYGKYEKTSVTISREPGIITEEKGAYYFFHLPEAGRLETDELEYGQRLNHNFGESANSIIEAGFSRILTEEKRVIRARLYLTTGYYNKDDEFICRPDCIVKVYNSLARYVRKLAPYTEITRKYINRSGEPDEYTTKEYISPYCLDLLKNEGYDLL